MKIKSKQLDFTKIAEKYSNTWLVLKPDSTDVVISGKSPKLILDAAWKQGIKHPVLMRAPKNWGTYIL